MNKSEFFKELEKALDGLPEQDKERIIDYYKEIIADRIESGQDEAEAVESVGAIEEIVNQALTDDKEKSNDMQGTLKRRKVSKRQLAILIAGSPLWIPLLISALAIVLALYICAWAGVFSVAVTEVALAISAPVGTVASIVTICMGDIALGFIVLGICVSASGIALIAFYPCLKLVLYSVRLTKKSVLGIVKLVIGGKQL